MKFQSLNRKVFSSYCYSNPIQDFLPETTKVEKICDKNACGNSTEFSIEGPGIGGDAKSGCSSSSVESIMHSRLERCDYYNASHQECISYINEELNRSCGTYYSCVVTSYDNFAAWKTYSTYTSKSVLDF